MDLSSHSKCLIEVLKNKKLDGDLDFIASEDIVYIDGNLGISNNLIPEMYSENLKNMNLNSDSTLCVVLINPECYSAWNIRKRLLQSKKLDPHWEYDFTSFLLTKHCSKPFLWSHRFMLLI